MNAPSLNVMRHVRLVVVPSGKTRHCGQSESGSERRLISSMVVCLLLASLRSTSMGWHARAKCPMNGNEAFSKRDTPLGKPSTKNTKASKKDECGAFINYSSKIE